MVSHEFQPRLNFDLSVTIAVGQTVSDAVDLCGTSLVGFITDANLTGTALTFQGSTTLAGTYVAIHNNSGAISRTVATSKYYNEASSDTFNATRFLKIVSGTIQATNPTVITLATKA